MELKDQVCTLNQAKKLKSLGVKADVLIEGIENGFIKPKNIKL